MSAAAGADQIAPYDVAVAVFGHGLDLTLNPGLAAQIPEFINKYKLNDYTASTRRPKETFFDRRVLPAGVCVVNAMVTSQSADVFGHVDKLFNQFQVPANRKLFLEPHVAQLRAMFPTDSPVMAPSALGHAVGLELEQRVSVAHGDRGDGCNFFDWTLLLGAEEGGDHFWVTKSGLYEFPIPTVHTYKVIEDASTSPTVVKGNLVKRIYDGSMYPRTDDILDKLGMSEVVGEVTYSVLADVINDSFPLTISDIVNIYRRGAGNENKRVVIYNFICRASPEDYLGLGVKTRKMRAWHAYLQEQSQQQQSQSQSYGYGGRRYKKSRKHRKHKKNRKNRKTRK